MSETPTFLAETRASWRSWLIKHHQKEKKVYLVKYKKHTGKPSLTNREAMEEAICFGWIDTIVKRLDDHTYQQCFVKRNEKSRWSNNTQRYAREMIAQGKMTPPGMHAYQEGLKKPVIDFDLPKNPPIPADLRLALGEHSSAEKNFLAFPPSVRTMFVRWILRAIRPETRKNRIKVVVEKALHNIKEWG